MESNNALQRFDESRNIIQKILTSINAFEGEKDEFSLYFFDLLSLWNNVWSDNMKEATKLIASVQKRNLYFLQIAKKISDKTLQKICWWSYSRIIKYYLQAGEWSKAVRSIKESIALALELNNSFAIYWSYNLGYFNRKEFINYLDPFLHLTERLNYFESTKDEFYIIHCLDSLATIHRIFGDINKTLMFYKKAKEILHQIPDLDEGQIRLKFNIYYWSGNIHTGIGKYAEASIDYRETQKYAQLLLENYDFKQPESMVLEALGEYYEEIGNYQQALNYQEKYYQLVEDSNYTAEISESHYQMIKILIKMNNLAKANELFKKFESIKKTWKNYNYFDFEFKFKIIQALLLIEMKEIKKTSQAEELLEDVLNTPNVKDELILDAIIPLIVLKIQEYKIYQNEKIFETIGELIAKLRDYILKFNSVPLKIQYYIFQSKIDLINGDFDSFNRSLQGAEKLAKEYGLEQYKNLIRTEMQEVNGELSKWKALMNENNPIKAKLESLEIEEYIKGIRSFLAEN